MIGLPVSVAEKKFAELFLFANPNKHTVYGSTIKVCKTLVSERGVLVLTQERQIHFLLLMRSNQAPRTILGSE